MIGQLPPAWIDYSPYESTRDIATVHVPLIELSSGNCVIQFWKIPPQPAVHVA